MNKNSKIVFLVKEVYSTWLKEDIMNLSASLAFYVMLAIFPCLVAIKYIMGDLFVLSEYVPEISLEARGELLAGGIFVAIFSVVKCIRRIKKYLDEIFTQGKTKDFIASWFFSLIMALYFLMLLYLSVIGIGFGREIVESFIDIPISLFSTITTIILAFLFLTLMFRYLPEKKHRFVEVLPGTFFTVVAWIVASVGFRIWVENFSHYSLLEEGVGGTIALMLWIFVLSNILLIGASIISAFSKMKTNYRGARTE